MYVYKYLLDCDSTLRTFFVNIHLCYIFFLFIYIFISFKCYSYSCSVLKYSLFSSYYLPSSSTPSIGMCMLKCFFKEAKAHHASKIG